MRRQETAIYGQTVLPCKVTRAGIWLAVTRLVLPFLLILLALDLMIWAVARFGFGVCYGIWCWF